jgi:hypothetical protein
MSGGGNRNSILLFLIIVVVVIPLALIGVGKYEPVKLGIMHEQLLGLMKGGAFGSSEEVEVEGCEQVKGLDGYWAVRRVTRFTKFADGSTLTLIYSEPPEETGTECP